VLHNGDSVEITTSKNSWPNTSWLSYAVTAKARTSIRNFLKQQTEEDALKLGKRLLAGATKQRLFGRRRINKEVQNKLLEELQLETWSDLLIDVGLGNRLPDIVARQIAQLSNVENTGGKIIGQEALVIQGSEGLLITYSKCCFPVPGDAILGTFTSGHGLVVHTSDCPNITELIKQPERCLMVDWDDKLDQKFSVKLQVKMKHMPGAFAEVATVIAENESNINHVDSNEGLDGFRVINFVIDVKNRIHLAHIMKAIKVKPSVIKVNRKKG